MLVMSYIGKSNINWEIVNMKITVDGKEMLINNRFKVNFMEKICVFSAKV